ncbi:lipid-transfer protein [Mycobacterium sp. E1747]|uniref:thiolase C-terminal domain-containing protein n=1 Tax=Mycobacterium sp. E1747 TaxID=1834128 RepID=UPI0007FDBB57|nr:lipid-transfer protein [Mycobacterium sp. E1747]OBH08895.1 lipid-transfer protein [Mycobacterium sp. E1747]
MTRDFPRDQCAVVGIGSTDFSRESGRSTLTLAVQAALAAAEDAGIDPKDVDGIISSDADLVRHNDLATALGVHQLTYWGQAGAGGAAPSGMVGQAVAAVVSGLASTVLVFRALNGRSGRRWGRGRASRAFVGGNGSQDEFFIPYGLTAPGQLWALQAQYHFDKYGTTSADLGRIAVVCRENAMSNPAAQMHGRELTLAMHQESWVLSSPLRLLDYCLETDGACALIITSTERARDLPGHPVLIRAVAQGAGANVQGGLFYPSILRADLDDQPSVSLSRTLYARAGLGPHEIDVAQFYDCFTITVLVQLEQYGFCKRGEAASFIANGGIGRDGVLPINTAGGHLSEGYIHGMNHLVEGVRQLRGNSTNPVASAETCLVTSGLPVASSALILTKDR